MKKSIAILIVAAMLFALSVGAVVFASSTDGVDDSQILVTKEYFDAELKKVKNSISSSSSGLEFKVLENLSIGTKVVGGSSTEMILRAGGAKVVIPSSASGGVSDLTLGMDLKNLTKVTMNHLLLFPRNDGRALEVTKDGTYIMVKGDYKLQ